MESCLGRTDPDQNNFGLQNGAETVFGLTLMYGVVCGTLSYFLSLTAVLFCILCVVAAAMTASEALEKKHPAAWALYMLGGILAVLAFSIGITNYHTFYAPYVDAKMGQEYHALRASSSARAHRDGGLLNFEQKTLVDSTRSLGLLSHGTSYCVAPVLDVDTEQAVSSSPSSPSLLPHKIQFWAVGMDCCGARGYFACDDSTVVGARKAFVYHRAEDRLESKLFEPNSHYDEFLRAVEAAKALYGITSATEPVLVRWVRNPREILAQELHASLYLWLGSTLAVGVLCVFVWIPISNFWHQKLSRAYTQQKLAKIEAARAAAAAKAKAAAAKRPKEDPNLVKGSAKPSAVAETWNTVYNSMSSFISPSE